MKAEKDVLKLVKDLNRYEAEAKKLRQALCDRFRDDFDGCYIGDFFVVDEPQGDEQDDGERSFAKPSAPASATRKTATT